MIFNSLEGLFKFLLFYLFLKEMNNIYCVFILYHFYFLKSDNNTKTTPFY